MELNRFKQLLEATMGNVKPLIMEQEPSGYSEMSQKLLNAGFNKVSEINLADGNYIGNPIQSDYETLAQSLNLYRPQFIFIYNNSQFTGYVIQKDIAPRSGYEDETIIIKNKKPNLGNSYFFKQIAGLMN
jgi:hypothetical protein